MNADKSTMKPMFSDRLSRVMSALDRGGIDAMILTPGANLLYLTGFEHGHAYERLLALIVRRDGASRWVIPTMNVEQVRPHLGAGQQLRPWEDSEGYVPALRESVAGAERVAFDDDARAAFVIDLRSVAPSAEVVKASSIMRSLRIRKDAAELASLRQAAHVVDQTIPFAVSLCKPGRTEADVDADLRSALLSRDPTGAVAFTIIASGPNGAFPHHETSKRALQKGDAVILDFGTRSAAGYLSDITVTCSVGEPVDPEVRKVYDVVHRAQRAAIAAVRPGVPCEDIDRAARRVIEDAGYGKQFLHRTGHGLGLQGHEPPFMVGGNNEALDEGMVFSVEPGIYLAGRFGVRLEVIVACGRAGADMINAPSAPELPVQS
jgi:Xaa-Pro aminopeptidase